MEIFYYLRNKDGTLQKQQVNKQQRACSQSGRQHMVNLASFELILHNQIKGGLAFIPFS